MNRVFLILLLAALLLPPPVSPKDGKPPSGTLLVDMQPLALDSADPDRTSAGRLRYLAGWTLTSRQKDFGGISSMALRGDGSLLALSDSGILFGLPAGDISTGRQFIAPLPIRPEEKQLPGWTWDSESMQFDPVSGRYWVGFELIQRICRYAPGFARIESCRTWPEIQAWPDTGSIESMVRMPDGRFLAISEMGYGKYGGHDVLLFDGDPTEAYTPSPQHLSYIPPQGYRPTDALWLGKDRLLVLNRRVTLYDGFTGIVTLVKLPTLKEGAVLRGQELARLAPPLLADNYEAMTLSHEDGKTILWIASDDNHEFFQRSLLLKFALPDDLR